MNLMKLYSVPNVGIRYHQVVNFVILVEILLFNSDFN